MESTKSAILDIETLSLQPDALVTDIAVLTFDRKTFKQIDQIHIKLGLFDQICTRHICPDTVEFHRKNKTLPASATGLSPVKAISTLADFFEYHEPLHIWIQGPDFDRPILEHLARSVGKSLPWDYWRTRDSRTTWNLAFPGVKPDKRPHVASGDCRATLADLHKALTHLDCIHAA